jgi:hypothetical protein
MKPQQLFSIRKIENLNVNIIIKKYSNPLSGRAPLHSIQEPNNKAKNGFMSPKLQLPRDSLQVFSASKLNMERPAKNKGKRRPSSRMGQTTTKKNIKKEVPAFLNSTTIYEMKNYLDDVVRSTHSKKDSIKFVDFLNKNKVNPIVRSKMVDWMIEVLSLFKSSKETLFGAIATMDKYLLNSPLRVDDSEVHIIGLTSMLIASKLTDVIPIFLYQVVDVIGRNKFTTQDIKSKELHICATLKWDLWQPTPLVYIRQYMANIADKFTPSDMTVAQYDTLLRSTQEHAEILCMEAMYDSNIVSYYSYNLIASSCIMYAISFPLEVENSLCYKQYIMKFLSGDGGIFYSLICKCVAEIKRVQLMLSQYRLANFMKFKFDY